ncbi:MAG: FAD-dependent oxidoreductase [Clostridia bacterium]|nr:FAD-dependent oxidoreductase [Clostridia bacterium]
MQSLWEQTAKLPVFPKLKHDIRTDVLVVGGGLAGLLCAEQLGQNGLDVIVAEGNTVFGGVSARTTAKVTTQHGAIYHTLEKNSGLSAAKQYYTAQREAMDEYRRLADRFSFDYEECDAYLYSSDNRLALRAERSTISRIGGKAEWTTDLPVEIPVAGALKIPHQAQLNPLRLAEGLLPNLTVYEHTRVRELRGQTAVTDDGILILAKAIIVATHFPFLNRHGAYFLKLYQHRSYVIALENTAMSHAMLWSDKQDGITIRRYGEYVLLAGGGHRTGQKGAGFQPVEEFAHRYFPEAKIACRFATQDCMSLDGVSYIGQYAPSTPSLYVATGFNGWGMTSAMVAALVLSGEITGNPKPFAAVFNPQRSIWHKQLAVNATESIKGLLTPTVPRCPHLGCALKWNPWEHSWDCGCHGSRFDENGILLNGPATGDFPKRKAD